MSKVTIAVASGKGGVGKSTVAVNLALALRDKGFRVGLLDADIYGPSQPGMLGAAEEKGKTTGAGSLIPSEHFGISFVSMGLYLGKDSPVVWRAPMAMKMIHQFLHNVEWERANKGQPLDYLIIDLPPGTGDVQLTLAQQASLSGAVIVSTPQEVALGIAKKGLKMFQQVNVPILGIVENMSGFVCEHCGKESEVFRKGGAEKMAHALDFPLLGRIPLSADIMDGADKGIPIVEGAKNSDSAKAYENLAKGVVDRVEKFSKEQGEEPTSINEGKKGAIDIAWPDGHKGEHTPYNVRVNCVCAACVDEDTGRQILDKSKVSLDIQFRNVGRVGRYALGIEFSDGHKSGIFSFKNLRKICECADCTKNRPAQEEFNV